MSLDIDTDMMATTYAFLNKTLPYKDWDLPPASDVIFKVTKSRREFGHYMRDRRGRHVIAASTAKVGNGRTLLEVMAHEIIHLHLEMRGVKSAHGAEFISCAAQVCFHHDLDPKTF